MSLPLTILKLLLFLVFWGACLAWGVACFVKFPKFRWPSGEDMNFQAAWRNMREGGRGLQGWFAATALTSMVLVLGILLLEHACAHDGSSFNAGALSRSTAAADTAPQGSTHSQLRGGRLIDLQRLLIVVFLGSAALSIVITIFKGFPKLRFPPGQTVTPRIAWRVTRDGAGEARTWLLVTQLSVAILLVVVLNLERGCP